jgi:hypothetical protein
MSNAATIDDLPGNRQGRFRVKLNSLAATPTNAFEKQFQT